MIEVRDIFSSTDCCEHRYIAIATSSLMTGSKWDWERSIIPNELRHPYIIMEPGMGVNQLYFGLACRHHFFQLYCKYHCIPLIFSLLLLLLLLLFLLLLFKTLCLTQPTATSIIKICAVILLFNSQIAMKHIYHILLICHPCSVLVSRN